MHCRSPGPSEDSRRQVPQAYHLHRDLVNLNARKKWLIPTMKPMWQTLLFFYYFFSSESIPLPERRISTSVLQHVGLVLSLFADYFISYNRKLQTSLILRMHMLVFFCSCVTRRPYLSFFLIYFLFNYFISFFCKTYPIKTVWWPDLEFSLRWNAHVYDPGLCEAIGWWKKKRVCACVCVCVFQFS